ncbi:DUF1559 domain-containing protein [Alienimonas chondri]|uniref:DUF1559 domain-containing protein n=1 Tax=Alienimonas chondri TaxID=2681879 RepID=A0ABX1VGQ3_9PLAN|nr:DUF1559 domain-containing protein [Alienimonas chondri]NNJ26447.1 hypothetical protein [Alienimonas chondri]
MHDPPAEPPKPSAFSFARVAGGLAILMILACGGILWEERRIGVIGRKTLESQNNVKNQTLAVTNFATRHEGRLDPQGDAEPSAPPVSWMTAILLSMDERTLKDSIDYTQPFDASENAAAFATVVPPYTSPFVGDDLLPSGLAPAHYAGNVEVFVPDLTLDDIGNADGATQTLMLAEVNAATGSPTAWGNPANLRSAAAPLNGPTGFGANGPGQIVVGYCDGRATGINPDIDPAIFAALGTPDGGETVSASDYD